MSSAGSRRAVLAALFANMAIALAKFIAFAVTGAAFLFAALAWIWIPETRGVELT